MARMARQRRTGLPTREQILDFIASSDQPAGKREIARAFGLSGADKIALKTLLKDMADEGLINSAPGRAFHQAGGVPKVTVLRVTDEDVPLPYAANLEKMALIRVESVVEAAKKVCYR